MKKRKYLVIHCTATPEGRAVTGDDIRRMHLSPKPAGNGWKQVGYTNIVRLDGTIEQLVDNNDDDFVDPWEVTNGVAGINSISEHIVYAGGCDAKMNPKDTRTPEQEESLRKFVLQHVADHPDEQIAGHNQFAAKACPSFDVPAWCRSIGVPEKNIYKKK